ncbi:hypothetical protein COL922a_002240 [Colletotrichum nupharicola]|nr:hypothetical protein COL922a_002240 [Colletotrichum nupharicola]
MEDKGPLIIAACWAFTGLSLLFVAARLFVRLAVYNKLMSDDYWIILSTVGGRLPSLTPPRAWQIAPPDLVGAEHQLRYIAHCHGDDALTAVLASKRCLEL